MNSKIDELKRGLVEMKVVKQASSNSMKPEDSRAASFLFPGLVIARLLAKDRPDQIRTLEDLRRLDQYKILIQKNSFTHDMVVKTPHIGDLLPRIIFEEFAASDTNLLQAVLQRVLDEEVVLVDDEDNFFNYLSCLPKSTFYTDDFFLSDPVARLGGAWIFPKGISKLKHDVTWKLQRLVDAGIYQYYKDSITNKLFRQHGGIYSELKGQLEVELQNQSYNFGFQYSFPPQTTNEKHFFLMLLT